MNSPPVYRFLLLGSLLVLGLLAGIIKSLPDGNLHFIACDVGQGDASLLTYRSTQVLVDGGPSERILDCLSQYMPFWDRSVEVVVLTHTQADHMTGLVEVLERFDVSQIIANGLANESAGFLAFREAVVAEEASIHLPQRGETIRLGPLTLQVLSPEKRLGMAQVWEDKKIDMAVLGASTDSDLNETSVVLQASYGEFDVLLTGDIGFVTEQAFLTEQMLNPVEVLKVAHHGSKYSTSSDFLNLVRPKIAVISVGGNNRYGHPTSDTLMRLDEVEAKILRTDERGNVEIVSDGDRFWMVE